MQFYMCSSILRCAVYYFNVTSPPEIYSLSLHDALPISSIDRARGPLARQPAVQVRLELDRGGHTDRKSTRLNSSHTATSYAVFCVKKKRRHKAHDSCARQQQCTCSMRTTGEVAWI